MIRIEEISFGKLDAMVEAMKVDGVRFAENTLVEVIDEVERYVRTVKHAMLEKGISFTDAHLLIEVRAGSSIEAAAAEIIHPMYVINAFLVNIDAEVATIMTPSDFVNRSDTIRLVVGHKMLAQSAMNGTKIGTSGWDTTKILSVINADRKNHFINFFRDDAPGPASPSADNAEVINRDNVHDWLNQSPITAKFAADAMKGTSGPLVGKVSWGIFKDIDPFLFGKNRGSININAGNEPSRNVNVKALSPVGVPLYRKIRSDSIMHASPFEWVRASALNLWNCLDARINSVGQVRQRQIKSMVNLGKLNRAGSWEAHSIFQVISLGCGDIRPPSMMEIRSFAEMVIAAVDSAYADQADLADNNEGVTTMVEQEESWVDNELVDTIKELDDKQGISWQFARDRVSSSEPRTTRRRRPATPEIAPTSELEAQMAGMLDDASPNPRCAGSKKPKN